ncbi:hypothetical protein M0802_006048 [Mischocyttarus mexicanus]|nr:hypothetical protein M0802_006048 [Mischocyttarus mexicanus]
MAFAFSAVQGDVKGERWVPLVSPPWCGPVQYGTVRLASRLKIQTVKERFASLPTITTTTTTKSTQLPSQKIKLRD